MRGAWQATIVDDEGNVQPFASVEVRNQDGAFISLFDAETGGSALSNPFDADSEGFARFYCDPQLVDIEATTASGIRTWDNVLIPGSAAEMQNETGGSTLRTAAAQDVEAWRSTVTVTSNHTVEAPPAYGTSIVNVNAATATITIPEGVPVGGRIHVRKIHETQGTVSIERSGTDTITRAALESVSLNADGDNWLLEKVGATRWELIAGVESGENSDYNYAKHADGRVYAVNVRGQTTTGVDSTADGNYFTISWDNVSDLFVGGIAESTSVEFSRVAAGSSFDARRDSLGFYGLSNQIFTGRIYVDDSISSGDEITDMTFKAEGRWYE